jgi:hypothetical protein
MTSGNATKLLDATEEAFDQVAIPVQVLIKRSLDYAMTSRWDHGFDPDSSEVFEDGVGVVGLVSAERIRL